MSLKKTQRLNSLEEEDDSDTTENHINNESRVEGAEILMSPTNPGKATVSYAPNIRKLEHELRHEKHPLQVRLI